MCHCYQGLRSFSKNIKLWVTINAQNRFLDLSWQNAPIQNDDQIVLTKHEPLHFDRVNNESDFGTTYLAEHDGGNTDSGDRPFDSLYSYVADIEPAQKSHPRFVCNGGTNDIVAVLSPNEASDWRTTCIPYNYNQTPNITVNTNSYGYWASYINAYGTILAKTCLCACPRWMHDICNIIGNMRLRDLFIPGTHNSGCYKPGFDPKSMDTRITKYTLTQDDDIRCQLIHGTRYLDLRVGYYWYLSEKFYIAHGFTRQRPLHEVIEQVRNFVLETNEIVILGFKQFPFGFGDNLNVHRLLVTYLIKQFKNLLVNPLLSWNAAIRQFWDTKQYIILAYDEPKVVQEFPNILFNGVQQRWGNVQNWQNLESYLRAINNSDLAKSSRPVADMAELTPNVWGVLFDQFGGLRKMADDVNPLVSCLYRDELGMQANIVAADFIRGTTLVESAIKWNIQKTNGRKQSKK